MKNVLDLDLNFFEIDNLNVSYKSEFKPYESFSPHEAWRDCISKALKFVLSIKGQFSNIYLTALIETLKKYVEKKGFLLEEKLKKYILKLVLLKSFLYLNFKFEFNLL